MTSTDQCPQPDLTIYGSIMRGGRRRVEGRQIHLGARRTCRPARRFMAVDTEESISVCRCLRNQRRICRWKEADIVFRICSCFVWNENKTGLFLHGGSLMSRDVGGFSACFAVLPRLGFTLSEWEGGGEVGYCFSMYCQHFCPLPFDRSTLC